jgi:hypothetical protein
MKKATLFALVTLFSTASFAQDYIKCDLKIADNKVDCPFLGRCPEKKLRESDTKLELLISEGETIRGEITLNQVVLHPGTKKEKKSSVFLFEDDKRHEKIRDEHDVDLVSFESSNKISYDVLKEGESVIINFRTSTYNAYADLRGANSSYRSFFATQDSAILFDCEKQNKEIYDEAERRRKAIEEYQQAKEEKAKKESNQVTRE